ncbi:hypothetical protein GCM10010218_53930 [Streptomyces mashuensis]|uniref:Thioesterase family protein n=1 Tax=Streptomyces mashuensis TaxID=33904 RepID=A0A919EFI5_9ACTN|nr:thioesterase family protein [Streptomyces mashuensis]GHF65627.1 hypothetical protein GCM10010218_53930 [Streptomyces mashuensis]
MTGAYFTRTGDREYLPTPHTQGPWSPDHQHFGPPGALLTRAIEQCTAADTGPGALLLGRVTFDILGPLPLRPLTVRARTGRPGRRVRLVHAELLHDGDPLVRASAWAVRPAPGDVPSHEEKAEPPCPPPHPDDPESTVPPEWSCGFLASMAWHFVHGEYGRPGPAAVWLRPRVPLVAGEPLTPAQRVVLAADSANGVSAELPIDSWGFVPPDLTVHFARPPEGDWLYLDARSAVGPGHPGLATSALYDTRGPVARSAQTLLIHPRG